MSKKLVSLALTLAFIATTATASFAADCKGEVTATDGKTATVKCEDGTETKAEGAAKVGDKVTVKDGKIKPKKKAIEGC